MIAHDEDILTSILVRLPPKPLVRFKLVSKQWRSLISSDYFSHLHTQHHRRRRLQPSLLLRLSDENSGRSYLHLDHRTKKLVPYHFPPNLTQPTISSSSNGLLLLQIRNPPEEEDRHYVYNPTSNQSRQIELRPEERFRCVLGLSLVFDPSVSIHYKIVCVRSTKRRPRTLLCNWRRFCVIEVYDGEAGAWNVIGEPFWSSIGVDFNRGVYLNGCVHWRGMFFDVAEGVVREHPGLEVWEGSRAERFYDSYVESRGVLHYVLHYPNTNSVWVFELGSDFSSWSLKYRVDVDGVPGMVSVVDFVTTGEIEDEDGEDSALVLWEEGKFMAYNFKEGKSEEIVDFRDEAFYEEGSRPFVSSCVFRFSESLACV